MANIKKTVIASFKIKVKDTFVYRGMMVLWILGWVFSFISLVFFWLAADTQGLVAGYNKNQIITYYFVGIFIWSFCGWYCFWWIVQAVKDGWIVGYLVKPMDFHWHVFAGELAWHVVNTGVYLLFLALIYYFVQDYLVINLSLTNLMLFLLAMVFTALVTFEFNILLSTVAFWVINAEGLGGLSWMLMSLFGGMLVPSSFFPTNWQKIIFFLPFRYMYSFPIEVFMNRLSPWSLFGSFLIAGFWIISLYLLFKYFWQKGLKNYTAFGQ